MVVWKWKAFQFQGPSPNFPHEIYYFRAILEKKTLRIPSFPIMVAFSIWSLWNQSRIELPAHSAFPGRSQTSSFPSTKPVRNVAGHEKWSKWHKCHKCHKGGFCQSQPQVLDPAVYGWGVGQWNKNGELTPRFVGNLDIPRTGWSSGWSLGHCTSCTVQLAWTNLVVRCWQSGS